MLNNIFKHTVILPDNFSGFQYNVVNTAVIIIIFKGECTYLI